MPKLLHDPEVYSSIRSRIESLRVDTPRQWGKMSIDQMLWHVNVSMREAVGEHKPQVKTPPVPKAVMRWAILAFPWGRGAPTRPDMYAVSTHDFNVQKAECLALVERIYHQPLSAKWPDSVTMGRMTGRHWSQLTAKHLDHHLKQFSS
ncbi:MAG TPA: DUF1569 domain-containing protein [Gemmatimonadaceae bacterium]|nr:DUF1569 domain-containing protein [Gemmatimonadaceae bacterium]